MGSSASDSLRLRRVRGGRPRPRPRPREGVAVLPALVDWPGVIAGVFSLSALSGRDSSPEPAPAGLVGGLAVLAGDPLLLVQVDATSDDAAANK